MTKLEQNLAYFSKQQCSSQWGAFLTAFGTEVGQKAPISEMRALMLRLGISMAKNIPQPSGNTLNELESSINKIWFAMDWGWIELNEKESGLFIQHYAVPLHDSFGAAALAWSPAILEGIYSHWFANLGAGASLQISQFEEAHPDSSLIVFCLGRVA